MTVQLIHGEHLAGALETEMTGRTEIRDVSTKAGECTDQKGQEGEKAESIWCKITGFLNAWELIISGPGNGEPWEKNLKKETIIGFGTLKDAR